MKPVSPNIFVVIPAYNEETVLRDVVRELLARAYQVVVVDDGSRVPLTQALEGLPVHRLRHRVNLGQGAALQTGIVHALNAGAEVLITFDADGQHDPEDIARLVDVQQSGRFDVVLGSRFIEGTASQVPAGRRLTLKVARWVNLLFTGMLLTDAHNGLRLLTAEAARTIRIRQNRMAHATELLSEIRRHRLRWTEVAVNVRYTDYARAKGQNRWSSFRILFDLLLSKLFS